MVRGRTFRSDQHIFLLYLDAGYVLFQTTEKMCILRESVAQVEPQLTASLPRRTKFMGKTAEIYYATFTELLVQ